MRAVAGRIHQDQVRSSLEDRRPRLSGSARGLLTAALIGHTVAATRLLDEGADPNAVDSDGRTPLMEAAFGGHAEIVATLLEYGADPNASDKDGWTALMEATSKGRVGIVRSLLSAGADANARTRYGCTPLAAAARDHAQIARLLRQYGASL